MEDFTEEDIDGNGTKSSALIKKEEQAKKDSKKDQVHILNFIFIFIYVYR